MTRALAASGKGLWLRLALCAAVLLGGCVQGAGLGGLPDNAPSFQIPPPLRPRPPLSPELATLVYPDIDKVKRDPFLTLIEDGLAEGKDMSAFLPKKPVPKPPPVKVAMVTKKGHHKHHMSEIVQRIIRQLHSQVHGIILGAPNVFIFKGRSYQEGDLIEGTDWVVVSVQETGIRLRSKDGSGSDYLPFATSGSVVFQFSGDDSSPKKGSSGGLEIHTKGQ